MRYFSTRDQTKHCFFADTLAQGLATDGGLFLPESIPNVAAHLKDWEKLSYQKLAHEILKLFATDIAPDTLEACIDRAFQGFSHPLCAPLVKLDKSLFVLELFHGPTLSFKDYPLQILGNLYEEQIERNRTTINVLGATSGDTGSAAISAMAGRKGVKTFILYPQGRIAPLQERQICCSGDANAFPLALQGTFDDCQGIVKQLFNDVSFKNKNHLSAVNSINWARLACQIVYYFYAYFQLPEDRKATDIEIVVPTGNFGNVFAGWIAQKMGLPIKTLRIATNQNDILYRLFSTGIYDQHPTIPTLAPSMDIQAASNFERFLYYLVGADSAKVREVIKIISEKHYYEFKIFDRNTFRASHCSDERIIENIKFVYQNYRYIIDPHTACGFEGLRPDVTSIVLSTAHPAKFAAALKKAINIVPTHPVLEKLIDKPIVNTVLPADSNAIKSFIEKHL